MCHILSQSRIADIYICPADAASHESDVYVSQIFSQCLRIICYTGFSLLVKVTVLVSVDGNVKTCGFDINILYDSSLELVSYDNDLDLDVVANTNAIQNGILLNFSSTTDKTRQRDIIELTFRVKNTTKEALPIVVTTNSVKEVSGSDIVDTQYSTVTGVVKVG